MRTNLCNIDISGATTNIHLLKAAYYVSGEQREAVGHWANQLTCLHRSQIAWGESRRCCLSCCCLLTLLPTCLCCLPCSAASLCCLNVVAPYLLVLLMLLLPPCACAAYVELPSSKCWVITCPLLLVPRCCAASGTAITITASASLNNFNPATCFNGQADILTRGLSPERSWNLTFELD